MAPASVEAVPVPDPSQPVHVVFVGAGAVGCFYASRLHHPEHNVFVSLIARSNYAAIAKNGVQLRTHSFGDYTFVPHAVFPSVAAAAAAAAARWRGGVEGGGKGEGAGWDYVVVTTKALPDRGDDSATIAPLVDQGRHSPSCIVLVQNGVGVEDPYRRRFPRCPIVSAVTVVSAEQVDQGVIRQNRWTRIHLGPYTNSAADVSDSSSSSSSSSSGGGGSSSSNSSGNTGPDATRDQDGDDASQMHHARALAAWLSRLGAVRDAQAHSEPDLQALRWHKLCINASISPSSILSGGTAPAAMVADAELRAHLAGVMHELHAAAPRVLGRPLPPDLHLAAPDAILASVARNTDGRPSMLLDWEAGRPLEIEVILGNAVRMARARGVELPRVQTLYALLRSAMRRREEEERTKESKL